MDRIEAIAKAQELYSKPNISSELIVLIADIYDGFERTDEKCNCTMRGKLVGDGCSVCNPQYVISILVSELEELRDLETWLEENAEDCLDKYNNKDKQDD